MNMAIPNPHNEKLSKKEMLVTLAVAALPPLFVVLEIVLAGGISGATGVFVPAYLLGGLFLGATGPYRAKKYTTRWNALNLALSMGITGVVLFIPVMAAVLPTTP